MFRNDEAPPLELDDDSFDLVWAISVFTHISDYWSSWLVDLHRILRDGGILLATIAGPDTSRVWAESAAGPTPPAVRMGSRHERQIESE